MLLSVGISALLTFTTAKAASVQSNIIANNDPLIYFHGRWDTTPGTWWAGTGFKLNVEGLTSMTLNAGDNTASPLSAAAVSLNYGTFTQVNISQGENVIPISTLPKGSPGVNTVVRFVSGGWQNDRLHLETIQLNKEAKLLPYTTSKLAFLYIGDSLSAGQYLPDGLEQAWPFLTGETFKAEHTVVAQPGACLTDVPSYGNPHGMSYQFFKTEDDGYDNYADHNYTTPWNFTDKPDFTHVVIHIGANDASLNITGDAFVQTYLSFVTKLRTHYSTQPIFVFTPWGWPQPDGTISYYYDGKYEEVVEKRHAIGDTNVFLVNTTGWVNYSDIYASNSHPNPEGHQKIAANFEAFLEEWGLKPEKEWATPALY